MRYITKTFGESISGKILPEMKFTTAKVIRL